MGRPERSVETTTRARILIAPKGTIAPSIGDIVRAPSWNPVEPWTDAAATHGGLVFNDVLLGEKFLPLRASGHVGPERPTFPNEFAVAFVWERDDEYVMRATDIAHIRFVAYGRPAGEVTVHAIEFGFSGRARTTRDTIRKEGRGQ